MRILWFHLKEGNGVYMVPGGRELRRWNLCGVYMVPCKGEEMDPVARGGQQSIDCGQVTGRSCLLVPEPGEEGRQGQHIVEQMVLFFLSVAPECRLLLHTGIQLLQGGKCSHQFH